MPYPLEDIKVIDLTRVLAGPYCTMMLGDMGAEILKIEPPRTGDDSRSYGPPFIKGESSYFLSLNRNKKSIVIDLKSSDGREILRKLVEKADVLVENFRPGVMKKLKLDYPSLMKYNPRLIYCSITGFGQDGPYSQRPGYDIVGFSMSGMMSITGEEGRPPVKMGIPVADIGSGMFAAYAILAALISRGKSGEGQYIDVSLLDGQVSWLTFQAGNYFGTGINPEKLGSAHPSIAPYQAFKAMDDYFIIAIGNDVQWRVFCKALKEKELADRVEFRTNPLRSKNRELLANMLGAIFASKPASHWLTLLERAGIPCGPINKLDQILSDRHIRHRGMVQEISHPTAGEIKQLGIPYKLSSVSGNIKKAPPILGEDTDHVLRSIGYREDQIRRFKSRGSVK